jgi:hypothetical protein
MRIFSHFCIALAFSHRIDFFAFSHFRITWKRRKTSILQNIYSFQRDCRCSGWFSVLLDWTEVNWGQLSYPGVLKSVRKSSSKQKCESKNAKTRICDANANAKVRKSDRLMRCDAMQWDWQKVRMQCKCEHGFALPALEPPLVFNNNASTDPICSCGILSVLLHLCCSSFWLAQA